MASILLSTAGSAIGASTGFSFGASLGSRFGQLVGGFIDSSILSQKAKFKVRGPRLADLGVQTSTYGKMIPIVYGKARIAGNIIWSRPITETITSSSTSEGGGKGGGGRVSQSISTYSYFVTLAIGICEGPIDEVLRIWADAKQLDLSLLTVRIYRGDEDQLPDSLIQSFDGVEKTPAYRGLAYVVFENFPLADYGNRIPNFTFEVCKKAQHPDYDGEILEDRIKGMVMIPGAGEFVYDTQAEYKIPGVLVGSTWVQQGNQQNINMHNAGGKANALLALDQLKQTCPNVEWISVVVGWFGNSLDAGACVIKPGVEYQTGAITSPDVWQVASFTRDTAHPITLSGDSPIYGGTPDDDSILRYLNELRARGYKILFYPLIFMDVEGKPWRGEITGSESATDSFFTKPNGYNAFITHYANLVAGKVDAFSIGSELKGLTKVTGTPGDYPAVNQLVDLASAVKTIVGSEVKVTYAADWSEYHHTDGGWYHLDPLWASSDIDFIGIDAYFPLTDEPQNGYDIEHVKTGWTSGEGYDWYYSDPERTTQVSLTPAYAWKNIEWFWYNAHVNPDATPTPWIPQSKKIWFTEYGFPSVDGATNQPNVFYDPTSVVSAFPYYSRGRTDFKAQRIGLMATEQQWKDSDFVERMFIWTWDARPFPYWPDLTSIWSDGGAWKTGHWVQGKLGISSLAAIVSDLCKRSGLTVTDIDVSQIINQVEGYVITSPQKIRDAIEILQAGYFFDAVESDFVLKFIPRGRTALQVIGEDDLVPTASQDVQQLFSITKAQEIELPKRVNIVYLNRLLNYQTATQYSQREITDSKETISVDLPIVFSDQEAKNIADITVFSNWIGRTTYQFDLPIEYITLDPTDIINVTVGGVAHRMRITSTQIQTPTVLRVNAVAEDRTTFDFYSISGDGSELLAQNGGLPASHLEVLDIPGFPADDVEKGVIRMAAVGMADGWNGSAVYRSDDGGENYNRLTDIVSPAAIGTCTDALASGSAVVFDEINTVTVVLLGSASLQSVSELAVLNGANAAVVGDEIIQFKNATLIEPGKYILSSLLRGRLGTEWTIGSHVAGERFVLLDSHLVKETMANSLIGQSRQYKAVTYGSLLADSVAKSSTYLAIGLKPYSPVLISATRDGSGNITLNWVRRARLAPNWQDSVDIPLNEASERYEIDIMNGPSVVRTLVAATPTIGYSFAQQITDFGSLQSSLSVKIYQMSEIVGRGTAGIATV